MNMYKELDQIIDEYVGVHTIDDHEHDYASNDPDLRDRIGLECTNHLKNYMPLNKMCPEAKVCFLEWETLMKHATEQPNEGEHYGRNSWPDYQK